jgi:hypothetical protein
MGIWSFSARLRNDEKLFPGIYILLIARFSTHSWVHGFGQTSLGERNMRSLFSAALLAGAATILMSGSALATTVATQGPYSNPPPTGSVPGEINFNGGTLDNAGGLVTWSTTGTADVELNSSSTGAEPLGDSSKYLSVNGGGTATMTLTGNNTLDTLTLFIGSVDTYNAIDFQLAGGGTEHFDGTTLLTDIDGITSVNDSGDQSNTDANSWFTFTFDAPVNAVTFSSTTNSMEIDDIGLGLHQITEGGPVPEPAVWIVMLAGFGLLGMALRSQKIAGLTVA